jgi:hypothetical protein
VLSGIRSGGRSEYHRWPAFDFDCAWQYALGWMQACAWHSVYHNGIHNQEQ